MGTRTWSRKGVLTAAGRRRQAGGGVNAAILDIWGDVIGDDEDVNTPPPPTPAPTPPAPVAPVVAAVPPAPPKAPRTRKTPAKAPVAPVLPVIPTDVVAPAPTPATPRYPTADGRETVFTPADFARGGELYDDLVVNSNGRDPQYGSPAPDFNGATKSGLEKIFARMGFNAKPKLFDTVAAFTKNINDGNVLTHPDGTPMIFMRSTQRPEFMQDLLTGDTHRVSATPGYFGTGTYIAGTFGKTSTLGRILNQAQQPDGTYNPWNDLAWQAAHVIRKYGSKFLDFYGNGGKLPVETTSHPITLSKDAKTNISAITDRNGQYSDRKYRQWLSDLTTEYQKQFGGRPHPNVGVMAAALGYDAVLASYDGLGGRATSNEMMVLNRGKMQIYTGNVTPKSIAKDFAIPYATKNGQTMTPKQRTGNYKDERGIRL